MSDLIVDPQIRTWVFLPIVIMTFLTGILRHYLTILVRNDRPATLDKIRETHLLMRCQLLRKNGKYLPVQSYRRRKQFLLAETEAQGSREDSAARQMGFCSIPEDASVLRETLIGHMINYLPMVVMGSWLMYILSGFIITKIPLPLTLRFKSMLQKDISLENLDAQWVSSASWYFLNVCGLRSIYAMILGENHSADQHIDLMPINAMAQNVGELFKNETEALVIHKHEFVTCCIEDLF